MNRTSTISFFSALALTLPAGWYALNATPDGDGAVARPPVAQLDVKGAHIEVSADQARVPVGGAVKLTLVASADKKIETDLDVEVLAQTGSRMSRVPSPPLSVAKRTVHLVATPGVHPGTDVSFTLDGNLKGTPDLVQVAGHATQYTILVRPAHDRKAGPAAVVIDSYVPEAYALTIVPPSPLMPVGHVHVKNLTHKTLKGINLSVSSDAFELVNQLEPVATLGPDAETDVFFKAARPVAAATKNIVINASAFATYGGTTATILTVAPDGKVVATLSGQAASGANLF